MPPPQAEPIRSGYHCDVMETFGDPSNVMNDPGVVDGENETNTDDKVESLIMILTGFLWNILMSLMFCNIIRPHNACHDVFFFCFFCLYFTKLGLLFLNRTLLGGMESLRSESGISAFGISI